LATTNKQYDNAVQICRDLFKKKMHDYGCAWRILRVSSLTDQIFIKAQRIRTLQQNKTRRVDEGQFPEFIGIVNYCVMALIQIDKGIADQPDMSTDVVLSYYNAQIDITKFLMENKNHDYGEAWRDMRVSSLTDLILQKLLRVKQIEDNDGKTLVSEGLVANYQDIINYAIFALIHLEN
jgi:predicted restriction endonuclease